MDLVNTSREKDSCVSFLSSTSFSICYHNTRFDVFSPLSFTTSMSWCYCSARRLCRWRSAVWRKTLVWISASRGSCCPSVPRWTWTALRCTRPWPSFSLDRWTESTCPLVKSSLSGRSRLWHDQRALMQRQHWAWLLKQNSNKMVKVWKCRHRLKWNG